jgi:hypothetical protein
MYVDWFDTIKHLPNEQLGDLIRHVYDYVIDGTLVDVSNPLFFVFNPIRLQIDRDSNAYDKIREQRSIAGKISANKRKELNPVNEGATNATSVNSVQQSSTALTVNVNDNVNDTVIKRKRQSKEPPFDFRSVSYFKDSSINELFYEYLDSRVKNKQPVTELVIERIVKKCKSTFPTASMFKQALEDTIEHGWKGIYLKETPNITGEKSPKNTQLNDTEPRSWKAGNLNSK